MDRPTDTVSTRVLLWGVIAPLLVGGAVPALGGLATVWLVAGLGTLVVQAATAAVRRGDSGEDEDGDDLRAELARTLPGPVPRVPALSGRWWNRTLEDPNTAAARAGSWG